MKPINIDYWFDYFNPVYGEIDSTELIQPKLGLVLRTDLITVKQSVRDKESEDDGSSMLLWIIFVVALITVVGFATLYYVMKKQMLKRKLQKALAEGKVSMKGPDEPNTDEDASPDKNIEMGDQSGRSYGQSQRQRFNDQ